MRIATWNVNSLAARLQHVLDWTQANPVDVLCLQELKLTDDKFPAAELQAAGYRAQWHGQRTYNGVALLSRSPAADIQRNIPGHGDEQALDLLRRRARHDRALARPHVDQAGRGELAQRLTDRRARDPVLLGQTELVEPLARPQGPVEDAVGDCRGELVGEGGVLRRHACLHTNRVPNRC